MASIATHDAEKSHSCLQCNKKFAKLSGLRYHCRIHTGEKPFACENASCKKTFMTSDQRNIHQETHTPLEARNRKHVCSRCGKKFFRACTMRRHERDIHRLNGNANRARNSKDRASCSRLPEHGRFDAFPPSIDEALESSVVNDTNLAVARSAIPSESSTSLETYKSLLLTLQRLRNPTLPVLSTLEIQDPSKAITRAAIRGEPTWSELLAHGPYSASWYQEAWFIAAEEGNGDVLQYLCEEVFVDVGTRRNVAPFESALDITSRKGHQLALMRLLYLRADVNQPSPTGNLPICQAIRDGKTECLRTLIQAGSNVDRKGGTGGITPLMLAALYQSGLEIFREMLAKTKNINEKNESGESFVHYAARASDSLYLFFALDCGADITVKDNRGRTILHHACDYAREDNIKLILQSSDLVNARDQRQRTALHCLCDYSMIQEIDTCLGLLLDKGAEVDSIDEDGKTPLMYSVRSSNSSAVERLVKHGADVDIINKQGLTALDVAIGLVEEIATDLEDINREDMANFAAQLKKIAATISFLVERGAKRGKEGQRSRCEYGRRRL